MASSPRTYRYRPVVARGEHHVEFEEPDPAARSTRVPEDMQQSEARPRGWRAPLWRQYRPLGEPDLSLGTYRLPPVLVDSSQHRARDASDALFDAFHEARSWAASDEGAEPEQRERPESSAASSKARSRRRRGTSQDAPPQDVHGFHTSKERQLVDPHGELARALNAPDPQSTSAATRGVLHDLRREIASSRHRAQLARGGVPLSSITPKRPDAPRPSRRAVIARRGAAGPRRLVEDAPAQTVGDSALGKGPLEVEEEPPYLPYTSRRARTPPIRVLSADEYRRRRVERLLTEAAGAHTVARSQDPSAMRPSTASRGQTPTVTALSFAPASSGAMGPSGPATARARLERARGGDAAQGPDEAVDAVARFTGTYQEFVDAQAQQTRQLSEALRAMRTQRAESFHHKYRALERCLQAAATGQSPLDIELAREGGGGDDNDLTRPLSMRTEDSGGGEAAGRQPPEGGAHPGTTVPQEAARHTRAMLSSAVAGQAEDDGYRWPTAPYSEASGPPRRQHSRGFKLVQNFNLDKELQSMRILAETERLEDQLLALQRNQWYNRLLATSVDDEEIVQQEVADTQRRPAADSPECFVVDYVKCVLERGRQFEQRHAAAVVGELEDYELERPRMQRMLSILRESLEFRDADWAALFAGRDVAVPGDAAASVAGSRASAASDSSSAVGGVARPRTGATAATVAAVLMSGGTEDG